MFGDDPYRGNTTPACRLATARTRLKRAQDELDEAKRQFTAAAEELANFEARAST